MLEKLKLQVYKANMELPKQGLVTFTWGNASGIDRQTGLAVIKPSGVPYNELSPEKMVVLDVNTGKVVEGKLRPSSDTPTHLELYRRFAEIGGIVHTHSPWATIWAQAGREIPALGTTHADYFAGSVPCTRRLTAAEVQKDYELHTGQVIAETLAAQSGSVLYIPAILAAGHGPFTWGQDAAEASYHAGVLEIVARMAYFTLQLNPEAQLPDYILKKHFERKHGPHAYYGQ